jgi:ABC-type antimicrobial peptide transport system permease subunit
MLAVIGLTIGLVIVRAAESALRRVVFEMSPYDPSSLIAAASLMLVVAVAACVPPALRALRLDPVEGLRAE